MTTIRQMNNSDVESVVQIHLQSFPGFFLTFLGRGFLTVLYSNIETDPTGICLVAVSNQRVAGFVAGVTQQKGFYRHLLKNQWWRFALAALGAVARKPSIMPRLFRALWRPSEVQQSAAEACLMSIAVRPDAAGNGIGSLLVKSFCDELTMHGISSVCLTTDKDGNDNVNRFYQGLGFRLSNTFVTREGRAMNEYVIDFPHGARSIMKA